MCKPISQGTTVTDPTELSFLYSQRSSISCTLSARTFPCLDQLCVTPGSKRLLEMRLGNALSSYSREVLMNLVEIKTDIDGCVHAPKSRECHENFPSSFCFQHAMAAKDSPKFPNWKSIRSTIIRRQRLHKRSEKPANILDLIFFFPPGAIVSLLLLPS